MISSSLEKAKRTTGDDADTDEGRLRKIKKRLRTKLLSSTGFLERF